VVPVSQLEEYTYGLAEEIVQNAPLSHRGHKRILKAVLDWLSPKGLTQEELELPLLIYDSEDYQEGVRAFLERRRPRFRGK
jgi:methylmalonyl-CoA decarboxylase